MNVKISDRIKSLRRERGITQKQLATETQISLPAIIAYENNKREPNSKSMVALESYFNVSGEYLRGETDLKQKSDIFAFNDDEIMDEVSKSLYILVNKIADEAILLDNESKKLVFDILVEFKSLLNSNSAKIDPLLLIKENIVSINKIYLRNKD